MTSLLFIRTNQGPVIYFRELYVGRYLKFFYLVRELSQVSVCQKLLIPLDSWNSTWLLNNILLDIWILDYA